MAAITKDKKRYNCVGSFTVVDRDIDTVAVRFIDACVHLTPARMADLDNLIKVSQEVRDHNAGIKIIQTREPKPQEVEDEWGDWKKEETEPTAKELRAIERGD